MLYNNIIDFLAYYIQHNRKLFMNKFKLKQFKDMYELFIDADRTD